MIRKLSVAAAMLSISVMSSPAFAVNYFDFGGNPVAGPDGEIVITEFLNPGILVLEGEDIVDEFGFGLGSYTVSNNTSSYDLLGFGVSNIGSIASVGEYGVTSAGENGYGYEALTLDAENWAFLDPLFFEEVTFETIFGSFSDNVEPGETTINWYASIDGALGPGQTSSDFFLFEADFLQSVGIGILGNSTGNLIFFNNLAITAGPGPSPVPLPAALPLLVGGLGMMGLIGRRKQKAVSA